MTGSILSRVTICEFRRSERGPKARKQASPGQRSGLAGIYATSPERAAQHSPPVSPLQGFVASFTENPGRCPGLACERTVGAKDRHSAMIPFSQNLMRGSINRLQRIPSLGNSRTAFLVLLLLLLLGAFRVGVGVGVGGRAGESGHFRKMVSIGEVVKGGVMGKYSDAHPVLRKSEIGGIAILDTRRDSRGCARG